MIDIRGHIDMFFNGFGDKVITVRKKFNPNDGMGMLGYCYKGPGFYKVIAPIVDDQYIDDCTLMHEYGHIYHGHLDGIHEDLDRNLKNVMSSKESIIVDTINANCGIDYAEELLDKVLSDEFLNHKIHNIAMDMEINSSILNLDDVILIQNKASELMFEYLNKFTSKMMGDEFAKKVSRFNKKMTEIKLIHPTDFGFSEGLTYPDYLVLILLNLDKFVNLLTNKLSNGIDGDPCESNSQGEDTGSSPCGGTSNQHDANSSSNVPKSLEEFEKMMEKAKELEKNSDREGDKGNDKNSGNGSGGDKDKQDKDKEENSPSNDHSTPSREKADKEMENGTYSKSLGCGSETSDTIRKYEVNNDPLDMALSEIITNFRHKVIKRDFTRDSIHKYNRKILGSSKILSPSYKQKITVSEDPTVVFYVDVSGSMDTDLVDRIITTIRYRMKKINSSLVYSIVAWDTELKQHYKGLNFNTPIPKLSCRGGTCMSGTFDHFKKEYGEYAIMILISDFEDYSIPSWVEKESKMSGYSMYGLNYGEPVSYNFKNFKVRQCQG